MLLAEVDAPKGPHYTTSQICDPLYSYLQRLKAALHYSVGHVCDELTQEDVASDMTFSKAFVAALNEATYRYVQSSGRDLELFAK